MTDDFLADLRGEITAARATGNVWNTEAWLHAIEECIERHIDPISCLGCITLTRRTGRDQTCRWCRDGGSHGFRWKQPIVLPEPDVMELVAAPADIRSDRPRVVA